MAIQRPKKRYNKGPSRRKAAATGGAATQRGSRTPITASVNDNSAGSVTIDFNQRVSIKGFPEVFDTSTPTIVCNGATQVNAQQAILTFNATPTGSITWPFEDPAVRNLVGGYVSPGELTFPE